MRARLFIPGQSLLRAWGRRDSAGRPHHPVLYSIARRRHDDGVLAQVVIVLDPHPAAKAPASAP